MKGRALAYSPMASVAPLISDIKGLKVDVESFIMQLERDIQPFVVRWLPLRSLELVDPKRNKVFKEGSWD